MNLRRTSVALLASLAILFMAPVSHAQLVGEGLLEFGPVAEGAGGLFPAWYMDRNGLALEACIDGPPLCLAPAVDDPIDPNNPVSVLVGFGAEAFYWMAAAEFPASTLRVTLVEFALEMAWALENPARGDQMVFARERVRFSGLPSAGPWTLTHPYGEEEFRATPDPAGGFEINFTSDIGAAPRAFTQCMRADHIGPFLRQVNAPAGFLGSPGVARAVTGGPNGNTVTLSGPGLTLTTSRFTVQGKLATNGGLQGPRATYSRLADGTATVDVSASSIGARGVGMQRIIATVGPAGVAPTARGLLRPVAGQVGNYAHSIPIPPGGDFSRVVIRNMTDASRPNAVFDPVPDVVTVNSATFDGSVLEVRASSSDLMPPAQGGPVLRVFNGQQLLGRINARGFLRLDTIVGPLRVRVESSAGGAASSRVRTIPPTP